MSNTEINEIALKINKLRDLIQNHAISVDSNFKYKFDDIISDDFKFDDMRSDDFKYKFDDIISDDFKLTPKSETITLDSITVMDTDNNNSITENNNSMTYTNTSASEQNSYSIQETGSTFDVNTDISQFLNTETSEATISSAKSLAHQSKKKFILKRK